MEEYPQKGKEAAPKGKNVEIVLKFLRHGERDKEGRLTDYGRTVTAERAGASGISATDFDAVKAIGSDAGKTAGVGQRALETADIYAHTIAGEGAFTTRVQKLLSYETLKNPLPYNHVEIYNAHLPENYDSLSDADKAAAARTAQAATIDHLASLRTPEADQYREEMAGAFAVLIEHYAKMVQKLDNDSRVLLPAGTHGGVMEFLLQRALIYKDAEGNEKRGFISTKEIGGEFSPSEAYNVDIKTDENGELYPLAVTFDNPYRSMIKDARLDEGVVHTLAAYYRDLHKEPVTQI